MADTVYFWEEKDQEKAGELAAKHVESYKADHELRCVRLASWMALYHASITHDEAIDEMLMKYLGEDATLKTNRMKQAIDTNHAHITAQWPRPQFVTDMGSWELRRLARQLTMFSDGVLQSEKVEAKFSRAYLDACVVGSGFLHVYADKLASRVRVERVPVNEIIVDSRLGAYSDITVMFRTKTVSGSRLKSQFEDKKTKTIIDDEMRSFAAREKRGASGSGMVPITDEVIVTEGWHLRSSPESKDGKHIVLVGDSCILYEDYERDSFPIKHIRYEQKLDEWYGWGLVEQLFPQQEALNKFSAMIQEAMEVHATAKTYAWENTINTENLIGDLPRAVMMLKEDTPRDKVPVVTAVPAVSGQAFQYRQMLLADIMDTAGTNEMAATGRKPAGEMSGIAMAHLTDIHTARHSPKFKEKDDAVLDVAWEIILCAKEIYEYDPSYKVFYIDKDFTRTIKWADIDPDITQFKLKCFPTNILPTLPGGRIQLIEGWVDRGMVDPAQGMALINAPDTQAFADKRFAVYEYYEYLAESVILEEIDIMDYAPRIEDPIDIGIESFQWSITRGMRDKVPEELLNKLRWWINQAVQIQKEMAPEPPPPMMPPGGPLPPPEMIPPQPMLPPAPQEMPLPPPQGQ